MRPETRHFATRDEVQTEVFVLRLPARTQSPGPFTQVIKSTKKPADAQRVFLNVPLTIPNSNAMLEDLWVLVRIWDLYERVLSSNL